MKNIALITIFTLLLSQFGWAQESKTSKNRRNLRKSGNSGQTDPGKSGGQPQVGSSSGRSQNGRPDPNSGNNNGQHNLHQIIKTKLNLTDDQQKKLQKIRTEYYQAVKSIKGGKEFSELTEEEKEDLFKAWTKFKTERAQILSKQQLIELRKILVKHRKVQQGQQQGGKQQGGWQQGGKQQGGQQGGKQQGGKQQGGKQQGGVDPGGADPFNVDPLSGVDPGGADPGGKQQQRR